MAVQGQAGEDVYATLLLSDTYLPGALVLAHSLRDAGTTKKLAVLITVDSVSGEAITQLKTVYDHVIPVSRIQNSKPENLRLMNRTDLHSAFTKINLWKQTQFRKIVYIDADIVAYRAPDELFDIAHPISAAPDIGWPDLFNTGVIALTPDVGHYYSMLAMAEKNISFDGADQGLMNIYFKDKWNRISFTYNVTPSAHYQYLPAYRHFQSSINMVHFIGADKPWFSGRNASHGGSPYDEMVGRWWAVYDRHYRARSPTLAPSELRESPGSSILSQPISELVQYHTKGEYRPKSTHIRGTSKPSSDVNRDHGRHVAHPHETPQPGGQEHHDTVHHHDTRHEAYGHVESQPGATIQQPEPTSSSFSALHSSFSNVEGIDTEAREEQVSVHGASPSPPKPEPEPEQKQEPTPFQPSMSSWDAQRHPPPTDSQPEAVHFPATTYEMSTSSVPFVAPERYPSPPRNMWYDIPKEPPAPRSEPPKAIFPWETTRSPPSRVFADEQPRNEYTSSETSTANLESRPSPTHRPSAESSVTETFTAEQSSEPVTPITPTIQVTPSDPWGSFSRTNAWDEDPKIERYVDSLQQKHRRLRSQKSPGMIQMPSGASAVDEFAWRRQGTKLTDFPSAIERPSLPVTPAPIRRPKFWGGGGPGIVDDDDPLLPAAAGVPAQSEWDPVAQLQKLAKQQSEALLQRLGSGSVRDSDDLPSRSLPFGSDELVSPTYVAQSAKVLHPQPVKANTSSSALRSIITDAEATPRSSPQPRSTTKSSGVPEPSYTGPGPAYEKGEDNPHPEAFATPTEETDKIYR